MIINVFLLTIMLVWADFILICFFLTETSAMDISGIDFDDDIDDEAVKEENEKAAKEKEAAEIAKLWVTAKLVHHLLTRHQNQQTG